MTSEATTSLIQPDNQSVTDEQLPYPQFEQNCIAILSTHPQVAEISGELHNMWTWKPYNGSEFALVINPDDDPTVTESIGPRCAFLSGLTNYAAIVQSDGSFQHIRAVPLGMENAHLVEYVNHLRNLDKYMLTWLNTDWLKPLTLSIAKRMLSKNHLCSKLEPNWGKIFVQLKEPLDASCVLFDVAQCNKFLMIHQHEVTDSYHWLKESSVTYPVLIKNAYENNTDGWIFGDKNGIVAAIEKSGRVTMFACDVTTDNPILGRPIEKNVQGLFAQQYFRLLNISTDGMYLEAN